MYQTSPKKVALTRARTETRSWLWQLKSGRWIHLSSGYWQDEIAIKQYCWWTTPIILVWSRFTSFPIYSAKGHSKRHLPSQTSTFEDEFENMAVEDFLSCSFLGRNLKVELSHPPNHQNHEAFEAWNAWASHEINSWEPTKNTCFSCEFLMLTHFTGAPNRPNFCSNLSGCHLNIKRRTPGSWSMRVTGRGKRYIVLNSTLWSCNM